MSSLKDKLEFVLKHNTIVQSAYKTSMGSFFRMIGRFIRIDENLVLLSSYSGKSYNDSPKALFERMLQREDCQRFHYVWAFNDPEQFEVAGAELVKMDTPQYFITALKAKCWITNVNIERGLRFKQKNTVYVNTWHGTPLKTIGNAVEGRTDYNFSNVDVITADGAYFSEIMVRDFSASPDAILYCGRPREDELYDLQLHGSREDICSRLGVDPSSRIVLYAPTWRESDDGGASYAIKPPINLEEWKKELGPNAVILFRAHSITTKVMGITFDNQVIDCSNYDSVNELMFVADMMISDYSGILFDYAGLGKPLLCFAYDFDEYSRERGMYFDIREHLSTFTDEKSLLNYITSMDCEAECEKSKAFFKTFAGYGGNATDACIDALIEKIKA